MGILRMAFSKKYQEKWADQQVDKIKLFQEGRRCPFCHAETEPSDDKCPSCHSAITGPCPKCGARKPLAGMKCEICGETFINVIEEYSLLSLDDSKPK